jgi:hypothetical protein
MLIDLFSNNLIKKNKRILSIHAMQLNAIGGGGAMTSYDVDEDFISF